MQTLDQLERTEHEQRQRAWQYEQITNELTRLRSEVARLTPQLDAITGIVRQLAEIQALAAKLSPNVVGTSDGVLRDQIRLGILAAEKSLSNRHARLKRMLDPAMAKIPLLEKQLEEFNNS